MRTIFHLLLIFSLFVSCTIKPQEIHYGEDGCVYCSMTIVDRQHAAQLVTDKGKAYKFDAAECMLHFMVENDMEVELYLVTDYSQPEKLIDATTATFIISENIPSPMRANLSALESNEVARELQKEKGGTLFTWEEIQDQVSKF
ncbi:MULTISPECIES: nitrous oxide reductase accessory protein NosL [Altibacter]|uniref:nitrous oxide reductase accessory protein NosL n=1 Tax=Altibacter TaxID=1535231 RepID=UPI00055242A1|nr:MULTISPECIES: nitrous oxide reductase accessory protein NosL [Altibacter]MCW8981305.1 nitrous oxide reductase accessory protein NosL [Altibacter sp.]MCW9037304.1 nitrous oxide reductase accessory protein NosL [Altibacter sp.]